MTQDSITRDGTLPLATAWTDLGSIMLSEISQSEKDKSHVTSRICGIYRTTNQRMTHNSEIWRRDCAYQRGGLGVGSVGGRWTGWGQAARLTVVALCGVRGDRSWCRAPGSHLTVYAGAT